MAGTPVATVLGLEPTFGFGDRLGNATPGHLEALRRSGGPIRGIFAQQSIREMSRTSRTPQQVMADAANALLDEQFTDPWGADADHLKTLPDVDSTAEAGFTMFTIDPSDYVDQQADDYDEATLSARFAEVRDAAPWVDGYVGQKVTIQDGPVIELDAVIVHRAAVKYGRAIAHAIKMGSRIREQSEKAGRGFEIELSVDETDQPTTLAEHYIIADQCRTSGVSLISLAPRFLGDFEKGVDFKGDLAALQSSLQDHAAIARQLGPYKLSLHSGSDKLSMYGMLARATRGMYHVKTAGTSYLEALRVVALHAPDSFREIVEFSRSRYDEDRATYHVSTTLDDAPPPSDVADDRQLQQLYLQCWEDTPEGEGFTKPGRQIAHCTFGSVLTHPTYGPLVNQILSEHPETYREVLCEHFERHLRSLNAG